MTEPDRIWINDKWEAYLRPTFDGDTSGYIRVDLVDPAVTVGVKPPFYFDRYINGVRMAEDVCVERETTLESAMLVAARIASKGPNGEAPVLVYRAPVTQPMPDLSDPVTVHANMLRGTIAKPTVTQIIHLYGVDALAKALASIEYERKVAQMKEDFPNGI